jgi:hypothetical protein
VRITERYQSLAPHLLSLMTSFLGRPAAPNCTVRPCPFCRPSPLPFPFLLYHAHSCSDRVRE